MRLYGSSFQSLGAAIEKFYNHKLPWAFNVDFGLSGL